MITAAGVMKTRPPLLTLSSDDGECAHAVVCKGLTRDESLALEFMSLIAGSPDMKINDDGLILTVPSEGMASEAMENLDGANTSDGDGITVAQYNEAKIGQKDEKHSRVETPEKPEAKIPRITSSSVQPPELFEKPAGKKCPCQTFHVVSCREPQFHGAHRACITARIHKRQH